MESWVLTEVSVDSEGNGSEATCSFWEGIEVEGTLLDVLEGIFAAADSADEAFLSLRPNDCPILQPLSDSLRRFAKFAPENTQVAEAAAVAAQAEAASHALRSSFSSEESGTEREGAEAGQRASTAEERLQFLGNPNANTVYAWWSSYLFTFAKRRPAEEGREEQGCERESSEGGEDGSASSPPFSPSDFLTPPRRRAASCGRKASSLPIHVLMHCFSRSPLRPPDGFSVRAAVVDGCNVAAIPRKQLQFLITHHRDDLPTWLCAALRRATALPENFLALDMTRLRKCIRFLSEQGVPAVRVVLPEFVVDAAALEAFEKAQQESEEEARKVADALSSVAGRHKLRRRKQLQRRLAFLRMEADLHLQRVMRLKNGRSGARREVVACNVREVLELQREGVLVAAPDCFPEPVRKRRPRRRAGGRSYECGDEESVSSPCWQEFSRASAAAASSSGGAETGGGGGEAEREYYLRTRRSYDDLLVLQLAARVDGFVVSNDRFKDLRGVCAFFDGVISRRIFGFRHVPAAAAAVLWMLMHAHRTEAFLLTVKTRCLPACLAGLRATALRRVLSASTFFRREALVVERPLPMS